MKKFCEKIIFANKSLINWTILAALVVIGFVFRFYGLSSNYPFWIDEFSTGQSAEAIIKTGSPATVTGFIETRNLLNHYLTALSMKMFGINEFAARFPSVIWGSLMILAVYQIFKKIFNQRIGLAVAILTTFSVIEITWSRQARSYALFQLVFLISAYYFWKLFEKIEKAEFIDFFLPVFLLLISFLTHLLSVTIIFSLIIYVFLFKKEITFKWFRNLKKRQRVLFLLTAIFALAVIWQAGLKIIFQEFFVYRYLPLRFYNHFWYYHSFLWRQYSFLSLLAFLGILCSFLKQIKRYSFFLILLVVHLVTVTFLFRYLDVRYLYPIFPVFFFAYSAYFLDGLAQSWWPKSPLKQTIFVISMVGLIVINGHKFTFRPRKFYSPNADMKEIPLVDYQIVYGIIKKEIQKTGRFIPIIDTWPDRIAWYLGRDYKEAFVIRSEDKVDYMTENNQKFDKISHFRVITNQKELLEAIKENPEGFVFIDGHEVPNLPSDALAYVENSLKLEMKFDRFSLDSDPYDTWPSWLYSWGVK